MRGYCTTPLFKDHMKSQLQRCTPHAELHTTAMVTWHCVLCMHPYKEHDLHWIPPLFDIHYVLPIYICIVNWQCNSWAIRYIYCSPIIFNYWSSDGCTLYMSKSCSAHSWAVLRTCSRCSHIPWPSLGRVNISTSLNILCLNQFTQRIRRKRHSLKTLTCSQLAAETSPHNRMTLHLWYSTTEVLVKSHTGTTVPQIT